MGEADDRMTPVGSGDDTLRVRLDRLVARANAALVWERVWPVLWRGLAVVLAFLAVSWLGLWLEKAGRALSMNRMRMNAFAISKELKIWPASNAEKLLVTVERLGERRIADAVERLIDVDRKNKSGLGDPTANVEQFLLTMSV